MRRAARLFEERLDELARLLSREQGKPVAQAVGELQYGIGFIDWFAEEARRVHGMTIPAATSRQADHHDQAAARRDRLHHAVELPVTADPPQARGRLAAGCTMVLKPAS